MDNHNLKLDRKKFFESPPHSSLSWQFANKFQECKNNKRKASFTRAKYRANLTATATLGPNTERFIFFVT